MKKSKILRNELLTGMRKNKQIGGSFPGLAAMLVALALSLMFPVMSLAIEPEVYSILPTSGFYCAYGRIFTGFALLFFPLVSTHIHRVLLL